MWLLSLIHILMQRLYENHKVLTYPRTDSRYLTADIVPTIRERLEAISIGPYKTLAGKAKKADLDVYKRQGRPVSIQW